MFQLAISQPQFPLFLSHVLKGTALSPSSCQEGKIQNCQPVPRKKHAHNKNKKTSRTQTGEPPLRRERRVIWVVCKKEIECARLCASSSGSGRPEQANPGRTARKQVALLPYHPPCAPSFSVWQRTEGDSSDHKVKRLHSPGNFFQLSANRQQQNLMMNKQKSGVRRPVSKYECSVRVKKRFKIRPNKKKQPCRLRPQS